MKRIWIIVILAVLIGGLVWKLDPKIPEAVGPYVLLLTLVAIVFYTWETSQLRIQQKEIMELSLKPHLISIFRLGYFHLCNIGNGPAVNIRIDDVVVTLPKLPTIRLRFSCPYILKKDESKPIEIKMLTEDGSREAPDFNLGWLLLPAATETVEIDVRFENLISKGYEQRVFIGKGKPSEFDPIDMLLRFLDVFPHVIQSSSYLFALHYSKYELMRVLKYCSDKGLINATPIETDQEGVVEYHDISITSKGSDYIRGKQLLNQRA